MFHNPGKKVKGIAIALFVILLIAFVLGGVYLIMNGRWVLGDRTLGVVAGVAAIVVGFLLAWFNAVYLYAWGSMVDDVQQIREKLDSMR